ncbi:secreted RxLR effector protein 161-like [Primulina tabacum]|uniref:secreted RxLR effector protein 161-like n=1 Tax=Primulina tabacum TaxID=48773 RepID=UPI003F5A684F
MHEAKKVNTPSGQHFKLSSDQCSTDNEQKRLMESVPYSSGVGSLMYGMVCTRSDLSYAVSVVSRFMSIPGSTHWEALKWIMIYLKGLPDIGLLFKKRTELTQPLVGYVDSDYAGNLDTRKSVTGLIFTLYGTDISWKASLQSVVALSTTEAKYIALTEGVKDAMWLRGF